MLSPVKSFEQKKKRANFTLLDTSGSVLKDEDPNTRQGSGSTDATAQKRKEAAARPGASARPVGASKMPARVLRSKELVSGKENSLLDPATKASRTPVQDVPAGEEEGDEQCAQQ